MLAATGTTAIFLALGAAGLGLLIISLLFDGLTDIFEFGDGMLSAPAIAAFVAGFGFTGALVARSGASGYLAVAAGVVAGVVVGAAAGAAGRSLMRMNTDATVTSASYEGLSGTVVTNIVKGGIGEISLTVGGQPKKMNARSDGNALKMGTPIKVVAVNSPTLVTVQKA